MRNDYNCSQSLPWHFLTKLESSINKYGNRTKNFKSFLTVVMFVFGLNFSLAQTTIISPTGDGGFENGSTFAANGWTVSNSANNPWIVGALSNGAITGNAAFVSSDGTTPSYSNTSPCSNYFWRDVTVPAGETVMQLSFNWIANGESTWDNWQVFVAPTTITPVGSTTYAGVGAANVPLAITGATFVASGNLQTTVQTATVFLPPSVAGTTFRLIFHWKSDTSAGTQPPAQIDNISLTSRAAGTFISVASGNWNTGATWDAGTVPTPLDNATVSLSHTVTADIATTAINNLIVDGTLAYATAATNVQVNGNLTVNSDGLINAFTGTTGKNLIVTGNLTNDGIIDLSVSSSATAATQGNLTLNGTTVQTVSGSGTFGGIVSATDATNTVDVIRYLTCANTSTATPNIIWSFDNIKLMNGINTTGARISLGSNKLILGNFAAAGGTVTMPVGTGILPGGKFSRWWNATATGSLFTAGSDLTNATSRYPFIDAMGQNRAMYISRTNATGAVAGELAAVYTDATTITTGLTITDGTYTVTNRYNGSWTVSNEGTAVSASSYRVALLAPNTLYPQNGNARVIGATAAISGTHQNGTNTPGAQRIDVTQADLLAGPLHIGIASEDIPFVSIASGDWNATSTWNKGTLPTCDDSVTIAAGHNVTVNSAANDSKGVIISSGATLTIASGDLKVGCTNNNNNLTNNGTLTVSGGTLNVNGNMLHNAGATFNQSAGDINIDGNNAGDAATSVASGVSILQINTNLVNLTGGTLTIVDPHANTTANNTLAYTAGVGLNVNIPNTHTVMLGNGVSTDAGGNATNGFRLNTWVSSGRISFGNLVVNTLAGTNRFVSSAWTYGINGDLTINANSEFRENTVTHIAGNIVNNGVYVGTSTLILSNFLNGTNTPSTNAQTISGTGVFKNLVTAETANLTNLTVNNSNATGVTLSLPLSVSGTLTMTSGLINTTDTNILRLGTATAGGTLSGTPSVTNMVKGPFARTIGSGNANTNFIMFPVGKTAYTPIELAPLTTAVSVMKAEVFDSNTGTQNASISNMTTARRWEAPLVSGTITNVNVRLTDANILATSIPVQAPAAAGEYTNGFGSVATATAGATTRSNTPALSANYTGFISFADSNACSGTPAPGNTMASSTTICLGTAVNLSLQNTTNGTGVTYQWQSSLDGTTFTDIATATNQTLTVTPTVATHYKCVVTCETGPATGESTAVQITFTNIVASTTPASRCGTGTVELSATPSAGAAIKWYANLIGGSSIGSGNSFTTPSIAETTTFFAGSETLTAGSIVSGLGATNSSSSGQSFLPGAWGGAKTQYIIRASELTALGLGAGDITNLGFETTNSGQTYQGFNVHIGHTTLTTAPAALTTFIPNTGLTKVFGGTLADEGFTPAAGGVNNLTFGTGTGSSAAFAWDGTSNLVVSFSWSRVPAASTATGTTMKVDNVGFVSTAVRQRDNLSPADMLAETSVSSTSSIRPRFIINGQVVCQSARTPVVATVTTPPALTISATSATICESLSTPTVTLTSTVADYNTYVWSPSTGVSGDETAGWVFNPSVSTTYTLTATQTSGDLCATTATYAVSVNPRATEMTITPATGSVCPDVIQPLVVTGGTLGIVGKIGSGTTGNTNTTPFKGWWGGSKTQALYTPAELTALGVEAGQNINSIGYVALSGTPLVLNDFTIRAGFVSNTTLGTDFIAGASNVVLAPVNYTPSTGTGNIDFALSTPLAWDGTSSLLIETCFNNNNFGGASANSISVESSTVAAGLNLHRTQDDTSDVCSNAIAPTASTVRPNLRISTLETPIISWSPIANLYTDAAATTAYVEGANATTVYFKSGTAAAAVTYTATSTTPLGCIRTKTVDVTVNALPTVVTVAASVCTPGTVDLTAAAITTGSDANLTFTYFTDMAATTAYSTPTAATAGTYYIKGTNANGCSAVASVVVTVNPLPTVVTVEPDAVCSPNTFDLTAAAVTTGSDSGLTFEYFTDAAATTAYATPTAATAGTYYIKGTNANGCSAIASVVVTVNVIDAPTGDDEQAFCGTANLSNLVVVGDGIKWYNAATNGTEYPAALLSSIGLVNGTTYYASQTQNGCESTERFAVTVTVTSVPTAPNASAQTFCSGATVADLVPNGSGLNWYDSESATTALAGTTVLTATTYYVSQTVNGCESPKTAVVITISTVDAPTGASEQTFSVADLADATIGDLVVTGTGVVWYATEEDAMNGTNALAAGTQLVSGTTYYAVSNSGSCSSTPFAVTVTVTLGNNSFDITNLKVYPNPVVDVFTVKYDKEIESISVFDLSGRLVRQVSPKQLEAQVDMTELAAAMYIVKVNAGGKQAEIKVMKK